MDISKEIKMDKKMCPICGDVLRGEIHNARPVVDGFCCGACNISVVIPTRLLTARQGENKND
tara:strand:+ start:2126 stop:2311 length:186 start_codon:yes stop_codon:yes gene_type:complete